MVDSGQHRKVVKIDDPNATFFIAQVGAPLEDIVKGIEEVDAVPGRRDRCVSRTAVVLDGMLDGVGWTMQDYLKHRKNDYYPPLANGHRLFLHDIRRVAVCCVVAMGEEGDMVVSF
ncbi:hypothetical protein C1H46_028634 [Malus baccata]|uniref:Uncharacterized protein n=1 Tax=Malus baccata TaxID=106549 RepID=A0A540LH73_MALBA|nr:hypothetical protein C1H46_028634 [Malus baccata]